MIEHLNQSKKMNLCKKNQPQKNKITVTTYTHELGKKTLKDQQTAPKSFITNQKTAHL